LNCRTRASMIGIGLALFWSQVAQSKSLPSIHIAIAQDGSSDSVVDVRKLARTVAANVHRILSETDAGKIEVFLYTLLHQKKEDL
jgi:hypothetical protein